MLGFNELGRKGWLGNQMFQYASTKGIARANGYDVVTPPADGTQPEYHDYSLWQTFKMTGATPGYLEGPTVAVEFGFHPWIMEGCPDNVNLSGFMQTEKYFEDIADEIREDFEIKESCPLPYKDYIAVHVRRGDYVTYSAALHPTQSRDYYMTAIESIAEDLPVAVFSDDIGWCMSNIPAAFYSTGTKSQDLWMMSHARHNVISNSTFGWWGAWLNKDAVSVIAPAPSTWFGPALWNLDTSDVVPDRWTTIEP